MGLRAFLRSLALPLQPAPLLLVAIFALLLRLGMAAGLLGIPMFVVIGSWFLKYAFMVLDHAAQGRPGAPVLTVEAANPLGEMRPLAWGVLLVVIYAATAAMEGLLGPESVEALRLLALAALPAIATSHTITGSWAEALSPGTIVGTTFRLGAGYLLILCVVFACWWLAGDVLANDGQFSLIVRIALLMLLWLELFAVLGGVIHQRRGDLGFQPEHSPERIENREQAELDRDRDRFMDQVFAECRSGATHNAWASIEQRIAGSADPIAEYCWIHARAVTWSNPRLAGRIADELLPRLLAGNQNGQALQVLRDQLKVDPEFRPATAEHLLRLVELARDAGDRPTARQLLRDFDRHYPGDPTSVRAQRIAQQLTR
jgi:hypothetical protein